MIFVAKGPGIPLLVYKFDEIANSSLYWAVVTNDTIVEALLSGKMALRKALAQPWIWVVQADQNFAVETTWQISGDKVPIDVGPVAGYGLDPSEGFIAEHRDAATTPFLSVHFQGKAKKGSETLPLSVFVDLVNEVAQSAWRIFVPAIHQAAPTLTEMAIKKALVVPVRQPAFGSLLIELDKPRLNLSRVRQRDEVNLENAAEKIIQANDAFLTAVNDLVEAVGSNKIRSRHGETFDIMSQLLPHESSYFDSVTIQGEGLNNVEKEIVIDAKVGQKIWDKLDADDSRYRTISGKVVEISDRSVSFILRRRNQRELTCIASVSSLNQQFSSLRRGQAVEVEGYFEERSRRDRMWVREIRNAS
jgi:hypothetical protein